VPDISPLLYEAQNAFRLPPTAVSVFLSLRNEAIRDFPEGEERHWEINTLINLNS
jgi:hypothetical protein